MYLDNTTAKQIIASTIYAALLITAWAFRKEYTCVVLIMAFVFFISTAYMLYYRAMIQKKLTACVIRRDTIAYRLLMGKVVKLVVCSVEAMFLAVCTTCSIICMSVELISGLAALLALILPVFRFSEWLCGQLWLPWYACRMKHGVSVLAATALFGIVVFIAWIAGGYALTSTPWPESGLPSAVVEILLELSTDIDRFVHAISSSFPVFFQFIAYAVFSAVNMVALLAPLQGLFIWLHERESLVDVLKEQHCQAQGAMQ